MNKTLVQKLVEQAGGTYTMRNVITTQQNGLPIEMMERFSQLVVLECCKIVAPNWATIEEGKNSVPMSIIAATREEVVAEMKKHFGIKS